MWKYFVITTVVLLLFGCDSGSVKVTPVKVEKLCHDGIAPNVYKIIDPKHPYIIYTSERGLAVVPQTPESFR